MVIRYEKCSNIIPEEVERLYRQPGATEYSPMSSIEEVRVAIDSISHAAAAGLCIVARDCDRLVGFIVLYPAFYTKFTHQATFAVIVDFQCRGKGIGTSLVKQLLVESKKDLGIQSMRLEVYEHNPAYSIYKRLGFKEYGRHERFLIKKNEQGLKSEYTKILMIKSLISETSEEIAQ